MSKDVKLSADGQQVLDESLALAVESGRVPGIVGMLGVDGESLWSAVAGDMGPGAPMRSDVIMPLASVGKMYTATAVMLLLEAGALSVEDPVSDFIPEFDSVMVSVNENLVAPASPVTVHHLLTHTGGLMVDGDLFWEAWNAHSGKTTTGHLARALAELPLQSHPGSAFAYGATGASYEVLGAIVEVVSGQTLEEFMEERIFRPLGLEDSHFFVPEDKLDRLAALFRRSDGTFALERQLGEDRPRSGFFHGGGGIQASGTDLLRFGELFVNGGQVDEMRLLEARTVETMMRDHVGDLLPIEGLGWGYGAAIKTATGRYGWVGGGHAKAWIDPALQLVAYFGFPLMPPGEPVLLEELEHLVDQHLLVT
ncbi:MAG: serine hydrolase domain-containing protein [Acidimicrobiia bacterium]|nr:serine hydrolase domain-containing protein [Acidimicrobiia bacterium]